MQLRLREEIRRQERALSSRMLGFIVMTAPPTMKPEAAKLDAYFNKDGGTGKLLGVYVEGK